MSTSIIANKDDIVDVFVFNSVKRCQVLKVQEGPSETHYIVKVIKGRKCHKVVRVCELSLLRKVS